MKYLEENNMDILEKGKESTKNILENIKEDFILNNEGKLSLKK